MPGRRAPHSCRPWDAHESVVLMFYASRRMKHGLISDVILHKTGDVRSRDAVNGMIRRIRLEEVDAGYGDPYDEYTKRWDLRSVDRWLLRQLPRSEVDALTTIDYDLIDIISAKQDFTQFTGRNMMLHVRTDEAGY